MTLVWEGYDMNSGVELGWVFLLRVLLRVGLAAISFG